MRAARPLERALDGQPEDVAVEPDGRLVVLGLDDQPELAHASVLGWSADEQLLRRAGATVTRLGGCCGLAGNWGVERGHHDVSVTIAEQQLLPAVRGLSPDAVVLADGFSCRTQLDQLADRRGRHLAELLAARLTPAADRVPGTR